MDHINNLKNEQLPAYANEVGQGNGKLTTNTNLGKIDNGYGISNQENHSDENNKGKQYGNLPRVLKGKEELVSKFNAFDENETYNEVTTEPVYETTTDDYETTVSTKTKTKLTYKMHI